MTGEPLETVEFRRAAVSTVQGRRVAGEPVTLGILRVLAAPDHAQRSTDVARAVTPTAFDLYTRGRPPFDVHAGDLAVLRDVTCIVAREPELWERGGTVIGVQYRIEREEDA